VRVAFQSYAERETLNAERINMKPWNPETLELEILNAELLFAPRPMPHANCPLLFALCHSPFGLSLASRHLYLTSFGTSFGLRPSFAKQFSSHENKIQIQS